MDWMRVPTAAPMEPPSLGVAVFEAELDFGSRPLGLLQPDRAEDVIEDGGHLAADG